jgi:Ca2+-binding EF-hand superfamily protein
LTLILNYQGNIPFADIHNMLQQQGIKIQKCDLNKILDKHDRNKDGKMSREEFETVTQITLIMIDL